MTEENQDVLQRLGSSIVEIISDDKEDEEDSTTLGTGFVVTDHGLIVTCRHVIADSEDKLKNSVKVRFHSDSLPNIKGLTANLVKEQKGFKDYPYIDIAFLKLDKVPTNGVTPVKLDDKVVSLNHFASIGFKKAEEFTGLAAKGEIRMLTYIKDSAGRVLSPEVIQLYSPNNEIEPGMSGAPVLDIERKRVIGIITERYIEQYDPAVGNMAFALPVKSMLELYPKLSQKNQGLTILSKFLQAIGEEESSIYKWIDEVYVPPTEYDAKDGIKAALKRDRIVFITGTKEFGKTFTAVRLMYEYFKEGDYQPRWIKERKEVEKGSDPRELAKLMEQEGYIKPHQIVYFEDPFGKTKYETSNDLVNFIGSIMDRIKRIEDAYIIITSREEVFKQFEYEQLSEVEFANFQKKMNLKNASYDSERRKRILLNWARVNNCKWLLDPVLTAHVLDDIEYQQELLPTPMNIKEFALASYDTVDKAELDDMMRQKSKETARRFGDEIMRMEEEKILFLTFPYIARMDIKIAKDVYESVIPSLKQQYPMDFKEVMEWFEGDKINVSNYKIEFSHPSYEESFEYAIYGKTSENKKVKDIYSKALIRLADKDEVVRSVANRIIRNLDRLPKDARETLLLKLADKGDSTTSKTVASAIEQHFNNLPMELRETLLLKLADKGDSTTFSLCSILTNNFDKLSSETRETLLLKLADVEQAWGNVASAIAENFDKLSTGIQQKFLKLADQDSARGDVAYAILHNFNNLPMELRETLLLKLADQDDSAIGDVAYAIKHNFDKLSSETRETLLLKLVYKSYNVAEVIASAIEQHFNNLPMELREILLLKLADKGDSTTFSLCSILTNNFDKLSSETRETLLLKLADKGDSTTSKTVASAIEQHFNNLPMELRETLLLKLADQDDSAIGDVAYAIKHNFDKLSSETRETLLLKLVYNDKAASQLVDQILFNFGKLKPNIQEQLVLRLSDNDKAASQLVDQILFNFGKLPSGVQHLLLRLVDKGEAAELESRGIYIIEDFDKPPPPNIREELLVKLADNDKAGWGIAYGIARHFDKLPPNIREELLAKLVDKDDYATLKTVASIVQQHFDQLSAELRETLLVKLAYKDETPTEVALVIIYNFDKLPPNIREPLLVKLDDKYMLFKRLKEILAKNRGKRRSRRKRLSR